MKCGTLQSPDFRGLCSQMVRHREGVQGQQPHAAVLLQHHPGPPPLHAVRDLGGGLQPAGQGQV